MRKGVGELLRIQNVIESDRLNTGKGFDELLIADLGKLLKDYFDVLCEPEVSIVKDKNSYCVTVRVVTSRIKSFNCLPVETQ